MVFLTFSFEDDHQSNSNVCHRHNRSLIGFLRLGIAFLLSLLVESNRSISPPTYSFSNVIGARLCGKSLYSSASSVFGSLSNR
ncbi:MAG: hypothetical protein ACI909_004298 [Planctomycetota bacterium]|jgi:hypothetical protein